MKCFAISLSLALCLSAGAQANTLETPKASLYEVSPHDLTAATQVGDSVFYYEPSELACDSEGDEETPCLATVDHWETVCFKGATDGVCSEFTKLFTVSSQMLIDNGAEEDVQLLSCSTDSGIPIVNFDLISYHGGPNVLIKDKMIPMCPISIK